jgi:hypothetical protein
MPTDEQLDAAKEWLDEWFPLHRERASNLASLLERREREAKVEALVWAQPHYQPCGCRDCKRCAAEIARLEGERNA